MVGCSQGGKAALRRCTLHGGVEGARPGGLGWGRTLERRGSAAPAVAAEKRVGPAGLPRHSGGQGCIERLRRRRRAPVGTGSGHGMKGWWRGKARSSSPARRARAEENMSVLEKNTCMACQKRHQSDRAAGKKQWVGGETQAGLDGGGAGLWPGAHVARLAGSSAPASASALPPGGLQGLQQRLLSGACRTQWCPAWGRCCWGHRRALQTPAAGGQPPAAWRPPCAPAQRAQPPRCCRPGAGQVRPEQQGKGRAGRAVEEALGPPWTAFPG